METNEQLSAVKSALKDNVNLVTHTEGMLEHVIFEEFQKAGYPNQPDRVKEVALAAAKRFITEWSSDAHGEDYSVETENQRIAREERERLGLGDVKNLESSDEALENADKDADEIKRKTTGTGLKEDESTGKASSKGKK